MEDVQPSAIMGTSITSLMCMTNKVSRYSIKSCLIVSHCIYVERWDFSGLFPRNFATMSSTKNTVANAERIQQNKGAHYTPVTNANPCARGY